MINKGDTMDRHRGMSGRQTAKDWEDAFPGGNGQIGVLVLGDPGEETAVVNHERLFLPIHGRVRLPEMSAHLDELRRMLREGRARESAAFFVGKCAEQGMPGLIADFFHPAFDLKLRMEPRDTAVDLLRTVDFETGELATTWRNGGSKLSRRLFVSRPDNAIVMSVCAKSGPLPRCELWLAGRDGSTEDEFKAQRDYLLGADASAADSRLGYLCRYRNSDGGYVGAAKVVPSGGTMSAAGGHLIIEGATEILVIVGVAPNLDAETLWLALDRLQPDYAALFDRHQEIHGELFRRVTFDLGDAVGRGLTNEELLVQAKSGGCRLPWRNGCTTWGAIC